VISSSKKVVTRFVFDNKCFLTPIRGGVGPLKGGNSKFSDYYVVGSLNFCPETPGTMQKELAQSPCPEITSKIWSDFAVLGRDQNIPIKLHVLDVFSGQGKQIDLIPFALCQES
jgi:hypothetical protein